MVREYRDERIRQEDLAWESCNGWRTEYEEFVEDNPLVTFKQWLKWRKSEEDPDLSEREADPASETD